MINCTRFVAAAALAFTTAAHADVLFSNFGPDDDYDETVGWLLGDSQNTQLGAGFMMEAGGDYLLDAVTASIRHQFGPNEITLTVYDTVDGLPGNALESVTMTDLPPHDGEPAPPTVFLFSGTTLLEDGQTYWVIAAANEAPLVSSLVWNWNPDHAPGLHAQKFGDGPWMVFNFEQAVMRVEGTPVTECPADLTGDGNVGVPDLLALLAAWGPNPGHPADLTGDGNVGVPDLLALLAQWGPCP